ncbi:MAG TPA: hypothetical protein VKU00_20420 [Chthonomonadaceae bacterium]|nr:hypothetical protein [Chthonomonadaceae bacterium]
MEPSETEMPDSVEAKQIVQGLSSRHIGERLATEQRLKEMGPRAAELLLALLGAEARNRRLKRRIFWILLSSGLGTAALTAITLFMSGHPELMGLLGVFGGLGGLSAMTVPAQRYYVIIAALSQLDDIRAAGPLAEALTATPDINTRTAVARTLTRLLPLLKSTDAEWFTASQRVALCKVLKSGNPEKELEFMQIVLQALDTLEDVNALSTLESLKRRPATTDKERRLLVALEQSMLHLEAVRARLDTTQTLLRASSAADTSPEQLLRAAHGTTTIPAQQLLRAGQAPNEE